MSELESLVRDRLALGLDVPSLDEATRLASTLSPWFRVAKVGLELYVAEGPAAVSAMIEQGYDVFADLKLHDIPTTVERAARAAGRLGVRYLNMHAAGGADMLRAGVAGLKEGARDAGHPEPAALAVTVLTSDPDASAFEGRLAIAEAAGCDGVVCSALEVADVSARHPEWVTIVPGTRPAGADHHDQARTATPAEAAARGATLLVLARVVTRAADPAAAADAIFQEIAGALSAP
ncbi:MAG: orotidine-5'-phosphate decarboxylase [Actinobacteria bacterium]|nr:orotidine-5'-phosphate decarboxylase [Actinomycetota bacterium]